VSPAENNPPLEGQLHLGETPHAVVLTISGHGSAIDSTELLRLLERAMRDPLLRNLTVDLGGAASLDTTIIGLLLHAMCRMDAQRRRVTISRPSPPARRALRAMAVDRMLAVD
jgi:anti-anti-sigma regulatory factor